MDFSKDYQRIIRYKTTDNQPLPRNVVDKIEVFGNDRISKLTMISHLFKDGVGYILFSKPIKAVGYTYGNKLGRKICSFDKIQRLSEVIFPEGMVHAGTGTFKECHDLVGVYFPSTMRTYGKIFISGNENVDKLYFYQTNYLRMQIEGDGKIYDSDDALSKNGECHVNNDLLEDYKQAFANAIPNGTYNPIFDINNNREEPTSDGVPNEIDEENEENQEQEEQQQEVNPNEGTENEVLTDNPEETLTENENPIETETEETPTESEGSEETPIDSEGSEESEQGEEEGESQEETEPVEPTSSIWVIVEDNPVNDEEYDDLRLLSFIDFPEEGYIGKKIYFKTTSEVHGLKILESYVPELTETLDFIFPNEDIFEGIIGSAGEKQIIFTVSRTYDNYRKTIRHKESTGHELAVINISKQELPGSFMVGYCCDKPWVEANINVNSSIRNTLHDVTLEKYKILFGLKGLGNRVYFPDNFADRTGIPTDITRGLGIWANISWTVQPSEGSIYQNRVFDVWYNTITGEFTYDDPYTYEHFSLQDTDDFGMAFVIPKEKILDPYYGGLKERLSVNANGITMNAYLLDDNHLAVKDSTTGNLVTSFIDKTMPYSMTDYEYEVYNNYRTCTYACFVPSETAGNTLELTLRTG